MENDDEIPMDSVERRVAELFMFDFEQSGIHLDEEKVNLGIWGLKGKWREFYIILKKKNILWPLNDVRLGGSVEMKSTWI